MAGVSGRLGHFTPSFLSSPTSSSPSSYGIILSNNRTIYGPIPSGVHSLFHLPQPSPAAPNSLSLTTSTHEQQNLALSIMTSNKQLPGCQTCALDTDHPSLLLCSTCKFGECHFYCAVNPCMIRIPGGEWCCWECIYARKVDVKAKSRVIKAKVVVSADVNVVQGSSVERKVKVKVKVHVDVNAVRSRSKEKGKEKGKNDVRVRERSNREVVVQKKTHKKVFKDVVVKSEGRDLGKRHRPSISSRSGGRSSFASDVIDDSIDIPVDDDDDDDGEGGDNVFGSEEENLYKKTYTPSKRNDEAEQLSLVKRQSSSAKYKNELESTLINIGPGPVAKRSAQSMIRQNASYEDEDDDEFNPNARPGAATNKRSNQNPKQKRPRKPAIKGKRAYQMESVVDKYRSFRAPVAGAVMTVPSEVTAYGGGSDGGCYGKRLQQKKVKEFSSSLVDLPPPDQGQSQNQGQNQNQIKRSQQRKASSQTLPPPPPIIEEDDDSISDLTEDDIYASLPSDSVLEEWNYTTNWTNSGNCGGFDSSLFSNPCLNDTDDDDDDGDGEDEYNVGFNEGDEDGDGGDGNGEKKQAKKRRNIFKTRVRKTNKIADGDVVEEEDDIFDDEDEITRRYYYDDVCNLDGDSLGSYPYPSSDQDSSNSQNAIHINTQPYIKNPQSTTANPLLKQPFWPCMILPKNNLLIPKSLIKVYEKQEKGRVSWYKDELQNEKRRVRKAVQRGISIGPGGSGKVVVKRVRKLERRVFVILLPSDAEKRDVILDAKNATKSLPNGIYPEVLIRTVSELIPFEEGVERGALLVGKLVFSVAVAVEGGRGVWGVEGAAGFEKAVDGAVKGYEVESGIVDEVDGGGIRKGGRERRERER